MLKMQRRVEASQTRIMQSLLPLTKRRLGSALCAGSQACFQQLQQQEQQRAKACVSVKFVFPGLLLTLMTAAAAAAAAAGGQQRSMVCV
jgi:hypothetical protein